MKEYVVNADAISLKRDGTVEIGLLDPEQDHNQTAVVRVTEAELIKLRGLLTDALTS